MPLQGRCTATNKSAACTSCAVALAHSSKAPAGDRDVLAACPKMAAGHYQLEFAVPVELVPAAPAATLFGQLQTSFAATARDGSTAAARGVLPETPRVTWSWWGPAGFVVRQTAPVTIDRDAAIDIAVALRDVRYFVPRQTQGPAHRDGTLVVHKGELVRLERVPDRTAIDTAAPRQFSDKIIAAVVPGRTSRNQVEALLGDPWRTVAPDADENEPEVWEYRGKDASGGYRIHIEFDDKGTTSLIVKISDKTLNGIPRTARTPAAERP